MTVNPPWNALVGKRVVVRRRLADGRLGDVLGELLQAAGGVLVIETRRGVVEVAEADVVAGKPVPPAPARAAPAHLALTSSALETLAADHWQAAATERLGQWLLRADGGFTGRANSALALGDPGMPLPEALPAVRDWYAGQGLTPMACLATGRPGDPDAGTLAATRDAFDRAGWLERPGAGAFVLTGSAGALRGAARPPDGLRLALLDSPDDEWLQVYNYRGRPLPDRARRLLHSAPEQVFAAVVDGDRTVAVARGSLAHAWAGITAVEVVPTHRRRGLARLLCTALAGWSWERGARSVFVQVGVDNEAALALYLGCGFERHHRYDYLTPGPDAGASGSGPQTT